MVAKLLTRWRACGWSLPVAGAYLALVVGCAVQVARYCVPGQGLTYFIAFGSETEPDRLPRARLLNYYLAEDSAGYDGQYYAQLALDPLLLDPALPTAIDNLPYRARRILFPAVAFVAGAGRPAWILPAYAALNVVCWPLLALVLLHWFPPRGWEDFLRWAGVLLSAGMLASVRYAVVDGPALLLLAGAVALLERGRPRAGLALLALGGLGKETSLLGGVALAPGAAAGIRAWGRAAGRGLLLVAPLAAWLAYVALRTGPALDAGVRNFDWPLAGYVAQWRAIAPELALGSWRKSYPLGGALILVALFVQVATLVARPQWDRAWWRIGAAYAGLMLVLGGAVWEGFPGAAARVLLPLQLAFNIAVPSGRWWRVLLVAGNLSVWAVPAMFELPSNHGHHLLGAPTALKDPAGRPVTVRYVSGWHAPERHGAQWWRWSRGEGVIAIGNPHATALPLQLAFALDAPADRRVELRLNGAPVWAGRAGGTRPQPVTVPALSLQPGENLLTWATDAAAVRVDGDPRPLAFSVRNLRLEVGGPSVAGP